MAGGLLNLKSQGQDNVILNGNPSKTFFKVAYSKYTNFGMQKFRIDYDGLRELRPSEESKFTFKFPRYAELLMDTYLVVTLPNIWSPIHHPIPKTSETEGTAKHTNGRWAPYDFRWIENIGRRRYLLNSADDVVCYQPAPLLSLTGRPPIQRDLTDVSKVHY